MTRQSPRLDTIKECGVNGFDSLHLVRHNLKLKGSLDIRRLPFEDFDQGAWQIHALEIVAANSLYKTGIANVGLVPGLSSRFDREWAAPRSVLGGRPDTVSGIRTSTEPCG